MRHEKNETRLTQDLQGTQNRLTEMENECSTLRQTGTRLEREQKQREACAKADSVRLHRQEEQLGKLKLEEKSLRTTCKVNLFNIYYLFVTIFWSYPQLIRFTLVFLYI